MNSKDIRICFVGDSFVNGTCDPSGLGWVGHVCLEARSRGNNITLYNLGVRGDTSETIAARWQQECEARLPEYTDNRLVFSYGVNDTVMIDGCTRVTFENSISLTESLLQSAASRYKVLMVGPPAVDDTEQNKRIKRLDKAFAELCVSAGIGYLSIYPFVENNPVWADEISRNDGSHPAEQGYKLIAAQVTDWHAWWF